MDYIMSGDPVAIEKVIQENRIRIQRGEIKFSPVGTDFTEDDKTAGITDTKYNAPAPDAKEPKAKARKK